MKEVQHHLMKVERTACIYTLGILSEKTKYIWLVCHGYGQSAEKFIYKFEQLDEKEHFIIAPEGLSRFYWNGVGGEVVASWMTSKNRENEIEDYLYYIQNVLTKFQFQTQHKTELICFGFSQGVATIMRFLAAFKPDFKDIILWAGSIPKEIDYLALRKYFRSGKIHQIYGVDDEYLTPQFISQENDFILSQKLKLISHQFKGTHRIDKKAFMDYVRPLISG